MNIEQALSSCRAIFDYASSPKLATSLFIVFFVLFPLIKVIATILKTFKKTNLIKQNCNKWIPKKLANILTKHQLDANLFLVSCDAGFTAVSVGFFSKKVILSKRLIQKLSQKELEAIVLHEMHHGKYNHSLVLFFTELIVSTFFFLPAFKDLQEYIEYLLEKSADQHAVSLQRTTKYIKKSLRKVIISENNFGIFPKFSYQIIDQRIDNLNLRKTKLQMNKKRLYTSFSILIVFFVLFLLNKKYAMAQSVEQKITCNIFSCVYNCVAHELPNYPRMSEINYSIDFRIN